MKRILLTLVLLLLLAGPAAAGNNSFGLAWGISLPGGNTKDYIDQISLRGVSAEWRHALSERSALGLNLGLNVFHEQADDTLNWPYAAVTGRIWKTVSAVPVHASWTYDLGGDHRRNSRPYVGLNAGVAWIERRAEFGILAWEESAWHAALAPEVGYRWPYSNFIGFLALKYHYNFEAGEFGSQQWLELRVGFSMD